jgi:hypothetical protein
VVNNGCGVGAGDTCMRRLRPGRQEDHDPLGPGSRGVMERRCCRIGARYDVSDGVTRSERRVRGPVRKSADSKRGRLGMRTHTCMRARERPLSAQYSVVAAIRLSSIQLSLRCMI